MKYNENPVFQNKEEGTQTVGTVTIRRYSCKYTNGDQNMAVRKTSVSRYHGGLIEGSPETPRTITTQKYLLKI